MKKHGYIFLQLLFLAIPWVYFYAVYPSLPEKLATHYNYKMEPDAFTDKSDFWVFLLIMTVVFLGVSLLINNLALIDPKRKNKEENPTFRKVSWLMIGFSVVLSLFIIYTASDPQSFKALEQGKLIGVIVIGFLMLIGNLLNSIKPNFFVGVRTPWTLSSEDNWRKTHRLAAKLWFWGGLILLILLLLMPTDFSLFILVGGTTLLALVPVAFSFYWFKQDQKNNL